jgi:hypothetical protein
LNVIHHSRKKSWHFQPIKIQLILALMAYIFRPASSKNIFVAIIHLDQFKKSWIQCDSSCIPSFLISIHFSVSLTTDSQACLALTGMFCFHTFQSFVPSPYCHVLKSKNEKPSALLNLFQHLHISTEFLFVLFMSMGRRCVSELWPQRGLLFISQVMYEYGQLQWNDTDREKPNNSETNLSQCHFVHHKSHRDWPGRETGLPRWEARD